MRDGRMLVGWRTATGVWGAFQRPASARVTLRVDGIAHVTSATSDIGPGTYTVMTMIAAEYLGIVGEFLADPLTNPPSGAATASQAAPAPGETK
jgi:CO/xanthine dehydrogenase Mo-binding subunit